MGDRIESLKERTNRCVCKSCGSPLELRRIIYGEFEDARVEIFCTHCNKIEYGVEHEIYQVAKYFVEDMEFNAFPDLDLSEKTKKMNIAKVSEIIAWAYKNMGLMDIDGFKCDIAIDKDLDGESLLIDDERLQQIKNSQISE